jgi:hypothetical protein
VLVSGGHTGSAGSRAGTVPKVSPGMDLDFAIFHYLNGFAGRWYALDLFFAME